MLQPIISVINGNPTLRRGVHHIFYNYLARLDQEGAVTLMNYGYVDLRADAPTVSLDPTDEPNRLCLQLYHHVASGIDLRRLDVLEVGSGRGGGASYVKRCLSPKSMTGVDYSENAVEFCNQTHAASGVKYVHGDAESLPFEDATFDAVLNVESSHCYGSMAKFLSEVSRVLRPGGHLLWADFRSPDEFAKLDEDTRAAGLEVVSETHITPNVVAAMEKLGEKNRALVDRKVPRIARPIFYNFAGVGGSAMQTNLRAENLRYVSRVIRKIG